MTSLSDVRLRGGPFHGMTYEHRGDGEVPKQLAMPKAHQLHVYRLHKPNPYRTVYVHVGQVTREPVIA
jgi:hypothetical protein